MALLGGAIGAGVAAANAVRGASAPRVYRPAYVVRMTIRLDDFTATSGGEVDREGDRGGVGPAKSKLAKAAALAGQRQAVDRASGVEDLATATGVIATKRRAKAAPADPGGFAPPLGVAPDDLSIELTIVPLELSIDLNSFRIADKCTLTASFIDAPILPDIIRSVLIDVYAGTSPVDDFADPARWIPRLVDGAPIFRGYADRVDTEGDDGDLKLMIQARSLEARLMDKKIDPLTKERRIKHGGEDTAEFVRRLISTVPEFSGALGEPMGVRFFPNVDPTRAPRLDAKLFNRSLQSAQSRAQAQGNVQAQVAGAVGADPAQDASSGTPAVAAPAAAPAAQISVWDVIVRACELSGMIPVYDPSIVATDAAGRVQMLGANNLLIVPPQTIKQAPSSGITIPGGPTDGFSRTITVDGAQLRSDVRFFVWGHNVKSMKLGRKFSHTKRPRVRVVAYNPDGAPGQRTMTAFFPESARATGVSARGIATLDNPGKGHAPIEEEVIRVVRGIRDKERLKQIAVALWHQIGGKELTCIIETDELASYIDPTRPETHNENPDILRLRSGTPVRVVVGTRVATDGPPELVNTLSNFLERRSNPGFLKKSLIDNPNSSRILSDSGKLKLYDAIDKIERAYATAPMTDFYYTRNVCLKWSPSDGFSATIELANYVHADLPAAMTASDRKDNDHVKALPLRDPPEAAHQDSIDAALERVADARLRELL